MSQILNTSIVVSLFRHLYRWYGDIEQRVAYIYHNSQTWGLTIRFWKKTKICFRYSFLGKITVLKQTNTVFLDSSRLVQYMTKFYKRWKGKITNYIRAGFIVALAKDIKDQFNFFPVKMMGIIIVSALVVNSALSIVLKGQIGLWGWMMRGLLLFVAILGLFCEADWLTIKKSSIFLRKIQKGYEKD